ncbi:hypothetical protein KI387_016152, partial [Taxus chinensis]
KHKVMEDVDSEDIESLEAYRGKRDYEEEDEPEEAQKPPVFDVHDLKEEGKEEENLFLFIRRKGSQEEEGTQDKGGIEE